MIDYTTGDYLVKLVFKRDGSVIPKALSIAVPSTIFAILLVALDDHFADTRDFLGLSSKNSTVMWAAVTAPLFSLISFRTSQAWGRFWEGTSLLHAMRGEWFDSASCLATFTSNAKSAKPEAVDEFRHTLLRLMSLCHGSALDELKEQETENYEVLDIKGLDETTVKILLECKSKKFNRVEVLLHMIQVLVCNAQAKGTIDVPPPILSRVYQTLSRGFVNLLDAKKIKDTKFPFPYAQAIAVLLLLLAVITPITLSTMIPYVTLCAVSTFVPVFGLLCLNYAAEELEMPFGEDSNDLPLSHFQEEMNSSLLMLIHEWSDHLPKTNKDALRDWVSLNESLRDARNSVKHCYEPETTGGKRQSVYACQDVSSHADNLSCDGSQKSGWSDLPAQLEEGSHVASADAAHTDTTINGHASKVVTQPQLPVVVDSRMSQDPVLNSPGNNHGERAQALVSAAMSLQGPDGHASKVVTQPQLPVVVDSRMSQDPLLNSPGNNHLERAQALVSAAMSLQGPVRKISAECGTSSSSQQSGQLQGSNQLHSVGVTVVGNTTMPNARSGRGALITGAVPASSPTFTAAPSKTSTTCQESIGGSDRLVGPSRWSKNVLETPEPHIGDVGAECENNKTTYGDLGGQIFSGFATNPTMPTKAL
eukprot:CAMPEP_0172932124 /NCGR_PEP_ID=MMETSP1075-20121228/219837_1 /TAXON_ID=2916 /ORGANISM="Ceratium fusus, Strain PA161109" /LENGTH=647 /DNA_ID=CAMNT_0013793449 /DNA_START=98 /DNA_END=2042 /DNA_ORIENTATION=+